MKLPKISSSSSNIRRSSDFENIDQLRDIFNPFASQIQKVNIIKIYLKYNFHKTDIDDNFIKDIELEYANQFLSQMNFLPTKSNIAKLLTLKPIEQCDFHLSIDTIRDKQLKCIHIYPHSTNTSSVDKRLHALMSNDEFEAKMKKNYSAVYTKDMVTKIKEKPISKEENMLFNRETVDDILTQAKDDIIDKKLYAQAGNVTNDKCSLRIENIMSKFIKPNSTNVIKRLSVDKLAMNGKLKNIRTARKRDILNDPNYQFPLLTIELTKEIIEEVNKPIEIAIEIIIKDINFILDNFPIEDLIHFNDNNDNSKDSNDKVNIIKKFNQQLYYKLKTVTKEEVILIYKHIQTNQVYRVIGLTINIVYWIMFGSYIRIQIDLATKQFLLLKLLKEIESLQRDFADKKMYNTIYLPFLILIIRIEIQNVFNRKCKTLFKDITVQQKAYDKLNEILTVIYDPNGYHNTFTMIGGNISILKHSMDKELFPKYKNKSFATSNMIEHLFTNPKTMKYYESYGKDKEMMFEEQKNFIQDGKADFYRDILIKINRGLKRKNLDPIFNVKENNAMRRAASQ